MCLVGDDFDITLQQGDMEDGGAEDEPRGSGPTQQPRGILPYVRRKVAK